MKIIGKLGIMGVCILFLLTACSTASNSSMSNKEEKPTAESAEKTSKETKVISLYAGDITDELSEGKTMYSWGYGLWDEKNNKPASKPTIPGPEIRLTEGDHVKIIFHNQQKEPHTIHFHGIDNSFKGDGTPGVSQNEVEEGGTYTYEFVAGHAGTYFYHCHVEPDRHPEMGLYGAFIVEPKEQKVNYDGEFVLMLSERDPLLSVAEGTEAGAYLGTTSEHEHFNGEYDTVNRHPKYFTINGKMDGDIPPLKVKKGGKYLIRLINAGSDVHSIHTHGHHFKIVATDGRENPNPQVKDTISIAPGERYDLEFVADNPGAWPLHCHMGPHATHGMHTFIVYSGFEDKIMNHDMHQFGSIEHELAEMKEFLFSEKFDQLKAELSELSQNFDQIKDQLAKKDPNLVKNIEATGTEIAQQLAASPDQKELQQLVEKLSEQLNKAKEIMEEGE